MSEGQGDREGRGERERMRDKAGIQSTDRHDKQMSVQQAEVLVYCDFAPLV